MAHEQIYLASVEPGQIIIYNGETFRVAKNVRTEPVRGGHVINTTDGREIYTLSPNFDKCTLVGTFEL